MSTFDVILRGGTVVDGTGSAPVKRDIGITGDTITAVGGLAGSSAPVVIDATGMHIAPGFIDAHGHSDYTLLADGRAFSQVSQGVTTEVIGNCGHGCAPLVGDTTAFVGNIYGYTGNPELNWRTFGEYLERLQAANPAINTVPLVPNGNLRISAIDNCALAASPEEVETMKRLLAGALDEGAWGLSLGLEYGSERAASFDEMNELATYSASRDGILAVHTRNKERTAAEAVQEAIDLGRSSGSALQVSHVIPRRGADPDALERIIGQIDSAARHGDDIAFDVHTRLHGITHLSDALAPELAKQPPPTIAGALASPDVRKNLSERECLISSFALGGWDRVSVFTSPAQPELAGSSIAALSGEWGLSEWDAVFRVLSINAGDVHGPLVICNSYEEADVVSTARQPLCIVGSDATALCLDGPLAHDTFLGAYSWAGWIFSRLTTGPDKSSVAGAIRKLSGAVADRFGLSNRGYIAVGKRADIVVFEPEHFVEQATPDDPNIPCTGIRDVLVNGVITLRNSRQTSQSGGKVLRKGAAN